jgi:hypothetical protein
MLACVDGSENPKIDTPDKLLQHRNQGCAAVVRKSQSPPRGSPRQSPERAGDVRTPQGSTPTAASGTRVTPSPGQVNAMPQWSRSSIKGDKTHQ